jgi:hypothetical protein
MADDTKKVGGVKQPTEVVGPEGRGGAPKPEDMAPLETSVNPARTGVADREIEATRAVGVQATPLEAAKKIDEAAALRADFGRPKELLEADRLDREANDIIARQAEEAVKARGEIRDTTVAEAKVAAAALVGADMSAGSHVAQKFGNDPRNPQLAPGLDPVEGRTVRLSRKTPDHPDLIYTTVHPDMAGDYERAGWNRA